LEETNLNVKMQERKEIRDTGKIINKKRKR
jgi:hypothetical protein